MTTPRTQSLELEGFPTPAIESLADLYEADERMSEADGVPPMTAHEHLQETIRDSAFILVHTETGRLFVTYDEELMVPAGYHIPNFALR